MRGRRAKLPPLVRCFECGGNPRRSWSPFKCGECIRAAHEDPPPMLEARRAERFAAMSPSEPPPPPVPFNEIPF